MLDSQYTDSFIRENNLLGGITGNNIVKKATILLNGHERLKERQGNYFNWVQPNQHHSYAPIEGINVYSYSLEPENFQPTGSCNMSKIDDISLRLTLSHLIDFTNKAKLSVYTRNRNILRVLNGLGGLVFTD